MPISNSDEYISRDDESEAARVQDLRGVGELHTLTDEEIRAYSMNDFGMGFPEEYKS